MNYNSLFNKMRSLSKYTFMARWIMEEKLKRLIPGISSYNSYVPNPELEEAVNNSIMNHNCGVYVLLDRQNINGMDTVMVISRRLQQEQKLMGAICLNGNPNVLSYNCLFQWLKDELSISRDESSVFFSNLLPTYKNIFSHRILLVINNFDDIFPHPNAESFLVSMAEDSVLTKRFSVIVCTKNENNFRNITRWNGGQKIRPCYVDDYIMRVRFQKD